MPVCVEIEMSDDGKFSVGIEPQDSQEQPGQPEGQEDRSYLKPVADLNAALSTAKDLLSGSTGAQAQAADAEGAFKQGFAGRQPMGAPSPKPGFGG